MIVCVCRVLTTKDFKEATEKSAMRILDAGTLNNAIGVVCNVARKDKPFGKVPNCATAPCRENIANILHEAGHYRDQAYVPKRRMDQAAYPVSCPQACLK